MDAHDAATIPSYPISDAAVVLALGPAARFSMVEGGGERAHYQRRWNCGCVVLELDRRFRVEPCEVHREALRGRVRGRNGNRAARSLGRLGTACLAFVLLGALPVTMSTPVPSTASATSSSISGPATSAPLASIVAQGELAAFVAAWSRIVAYTAKVTVFEQNAKKSRMSSSTTAFASRPMSPCTLPRDQTPA
jgi:hypothetical protein